MQNDAAKIPDDMMTLAEACESFDRLGEIHIKALHEIHEGVATIEGVDAKALDELIAHEIAAVRSVVEQQKEHFVREAREGAEPVNDNQEN